MTRVSPDEERQHEGIHVGRECQGGLEGGEETQISSRTWGFVVDSEHLGGVDIAETRRDPHRIVRLLCGGTDMLVV